MKELFLPEASGAMLFAEVGSFGIVCLCYLMMINLAAFLIMWWDKRLARKGNARRIPEKVLFLFALAGGSIGAVAGMYLCRHKTKHWYFVAGMPLILIVQLALVIWMLI